MSRQGEIRQIRCQCDKRLGEVESVEGVVVLRKSCRHCKRMLRVTITADSITVQEIARVELAAAR